VATSSASFPNRAELRKHPRRHFDYSATIITDANAPSLSCKITDISHGGGRLELENGTELPDRFMLLLSNNGGAHRRCRVIWRTGATVGVEFCSD
jgi:PilZ domain